MWCGPLFKQVFASHFIACNSRVRVPELDSETQGHNGAMALAAAAVREPPIALFSLAHKPQLEHTLNLIANGEVDIRVIIEHNETTGNKRKRNAPLATWKLVPLNGTPEPFSDFFWGGVTCDYMDLLQQVPCSAMATIIEEAKITAEKQNEKGKSSRVTVWSANSGRSE